MNIFKSHNPAKLIKQELNETELQLMEATKLREYYSAMETMLDNRLKRLIMHSEAMGVDNA